MAAPPGVFEGPRQLTVGEFMIDRETIRAFRAGRLLTLSLRQFRLLDLFLRHPGRAFSISDIRQEIWGIGANVSNDAVVVEVAKLRRAIGNRRSRSAIMTIRGVGYGFDAPRGPIATAREQRIGQDRGGMPSQGT